jgi:predicted O-linked N-acetylglucosamine transferase (SPINDLY family)
LQDIDQVSQLLQQAVGLHRSGRRSEAELVYRQILSLMPGHADSMQLLGVVLYETGRAHDAIELIRSAIAISPAIASWHSNLGAALRADGQLPESILAFQRALELSPQTAAAHFNLANALAQSKRLDEALVEYRRAAELSPADPVIQRTLAEALYEHGDTADAIAQLEHGINQSQAATDQKARARIFDVTLLPLVYESDDEIHAYRKRMTDRIASLHSERVRCSIEHHPPHTLFRLAYQGMNDRDLMRDYASLMQPPQNKAPPSTLRGGRIRIGFVSAYFRNHTVGRLAINLVEKISRELFEVTILSVGAHTGQLAERFRAAADRFLVVPAKLSDARRCIASLELDVLFYTDIGMDRSTYALAFSRLARVQCNTWGQSVTSGVGAIDYYISSEVLEDASAQAQYTEELIRLPSTAICYDRPQLNARPATRADLGLPERAHLYGCLQTLYKFHPEFDQVVGEILRRDRDGIMLMVGGTIAHWRELLIARFNKTIPDVAHRIHWLPRLSGEDFFAATAMCDLMLDPFHFGGCTTSCEAFAFGVPVVTLPSTLLRGRFTQGFYRMMGIDDCIAATAQQYIDLAVDIGIDADRRHELRRTILQCCDVLFDNRRGVQELEQFLLRVAGA